MVRHQAALASVSSPALRRGSTYRSLEVIMSRAQTRSKHGSKIAQPTAQIDESVSTSETTLTNANSQSSPGRPAQHEQLRLR